MNNLNEMFGKIDKIDKIRKTKIQNTVVDKMNNLNENFGKIMFGKYCYLLPWQIISTIIIEKITKNFIMLFLLEKILKHMDKVIPSAGNSVDGKLLDCYYSIRARRK